MTTKFNALLAAAPLALFAAQADAAVYSFDLSGAYAAQFNLDSSMLAPPAESGSDYFLVNDVDGTFDGVQQVAPSIQFSTLASNGGFTIELAGGDFHGFFGPQLFGGTTGMPGITIGTFSLTSDVDGAPATLTIADVTGMPGGVPEPATWAMMIAGFAAIGFSMRRRTTAMAGARLA